MGKKQTPKSLALGMAVRQLTRSSQLTQILNGFGHCASHSAILTYETDLAKLSVKSDSFLPKGVEKNKFTCLVYDNDDFTEDSRNQTHILGGILIQREDSSGNESLVVSKQQKKGGRTFTALREDIVPYNLGKKQTPHFVDINTSMLNNYYEKSFSSHEATPKPLWDSTSWLDRF